MELQICEVRDIVVKTHLGTMQQKDVATAAVTEKVVIENVEKITLRQEKVVTLTPFSQSPAGPPHNRPIQVVTRSRINPCQRTCRCRCHSNGDGRFQLYTRFFGAILGQIRGVPLMSASCDLKSCVAGQQTSIEALFTFPDWFMKSTMMVIFMDLSSKNPAAGLFMTKSSPFTPGTIHHAARLQDLDAVKKIVSAEPMCVRYLDESARTPLLQALSRPKYENIRYLLLQGSDPDYCSHLATYYTARNFFARNYLFRKVAGLERVGGSWTEEQFEELREILPYHELYADMSLLTRSIVGLASVDVGEILGGSRWVAEIVQERDAVGMNPLLWAIVSEDAKTVRTLLDAGADPNVGMADGTCQPLQVMLYVGSNPLNEEIFDMLVEAGADLHARLHSGDGYLHCACFAQRDRVDIVKKLLFLGLDPNGTRLRRDGRENKRTPAWYAATNGNPRCLRALHEAGTDLSQADEDGHSPLIGSVAYNCHECLEILLEAGVDHLGITHEDDGSDFTILHAAAASGDARTMDILTAACSHLLGLDPRKPTATGQSADDSFKARGELPEALELAWERLLAAFDELNRGFDPTKASGGRSEKEPNSFLGGECPGLESEATDELTSTEDEDNAADDDEDEVWHEAVEEPAQA